MNNMQHNVLLVDDHPVFRRGLRSLLEDEEDIRVVGEAGDGKSALRLIRELSPDVVVMDITMPELSGIEATRHIVSEFPDTSVVALSIHAEKQFVRDMLQAGAAGYMLKDSGAGELIKGIRAIIAGEVYLSPAITGLVVSQFRKIVTQEVTLQEANYEIPETKFHVPRLPADHVQRLRLLKHLESKCHRPVYCIIAPAGYGKTTLVSHWLTGHKWPYAWISLDEMDNDLRKFMACFVYAIQTMFPNALSKSEALIKDGSLPPTQAFAAILVNELSSIHDKFTLVIDDFHLIREKSVHDLFAEIFRYPLTALHIIVVSRTDPFLPLSKFRAQNYLAEIRINDLRFTVGETETFLKSILGKDIDQSLSYSLNNKIEGWITGLRLAALSIDQKGNLDHLLHQVHGSGDYIKEYLFNEVWGKQQESIRRHIAAISIINRFNASLFEVVCSYNNDDCEHSGWDIITHLKKENLFLVPLDNEGHWFRFHHLFQELLQGQLKRTFSAQDINELHVKVGTWFAENGHAEEAVDHFLEAGKSQRAGVLVVQVGHTLIDQERVVELEKFLRKLPQEVIDQNPLLLIFEAWLARIKLMIPKISENLKKAEALLNLEPPADDMSGIIYGYLNTIRSYERYCNLDHKKAISCAKSALATMPSNYPYMRAFASIIHAAVLQMTGRYQEALAIMKSALNNPELQNKHTQAILLAGLSPICLLEADIFILRKNAARLLRLGNETDLPAYRSWGRLYLACSHYLSNDIDQAETILDAHLEDRYLMYPDVAIDGAVILSLCRQQLGYPQEARKVADLLSQHALETDHPGLLMAAQAFQAELAFRQGRRQEAIAWARMFEPRELHAHYFFFLPELTLAKVLLSEETLESERKTHSLLRDIETFSRSTGNRSVLIPTLLLQSMALYSHDMPASLEKAAEAVSIARAGGGLRYFLEYDAPMKDILMQLKENDSSADFVEQLLTALNDNEQENRRSMPAREIAGSSSTAVALESLIDPLTERELEILYQLVKGNSNKEIGEQLFISVDTVKSHLKRIFQKLNVKSRLQAVAKATELGVIEAS